MLEAPVTDGSARTPRAVKAGLPAATRNATASAPRRAAGAPVLRRDLSDDYARRSVRTDSGEEEYVPRQRFSGLRFRLRGGVPRSITGRVIAGAVVFGGCAAFVAVLWGMRSALLHDPRLMIASSAAIQTTQTSGNSHLTRAQLLSIFGGDVDRNILAVPIAVRRAELEELPWVEHATVMRLLPNKLRVAVVERTPVAFVRQGGHVGLVDAKGVLLEMSPDIAADQHYSFPVVTGIVANDPASVREARMQLYERFTQELDGGGEQISKSLSEVDLSSPEDVQALIPSGGADILVHLGDDDFLARYKRFEKNIAEWKGAHPNLASVDMRYDREAVLEMKAGTAVAAEPAAEPKTAAVAAAKPASVGLKTKPSAKVAAKATPKPGPAKKAAAAAPASKPAAHLQTAFDVHPKSTAATTAKSQADPQ